jgi:hypothetical protein
VAHDRHVLGAVPLAQARQVLVKVHIQDPMEAVLDSPM